MSAWERLQARRPNPNTGRLWPQGLAKVRGSLALGTERGGSPASGCRAHGARFQNICISRETGAGGGTIARLVGQRLGWKVYDRELLEAIAHRMGLPVDEVRCFDELAPSVVQDWLLPLREEHYAPQEAYLDHLAKLIEAIGRAGESVLVGRGAGFLLPRETTLSIRIIAPLRIRALRLAERMGVSVRTADGRPETWIAVVPSSIEPCTEWPPRTRTTTIWCSTRTAWVWTSRSRSSPGPWKPDGQVHRQSPAPACGPSLREAGAEPRRSRAPARPSAGASPPADLPPKNGDPPRRDRDRSNRVIRGKPRNCG